MLRQRPRYDNEEDVQEDEQNYYHPVAGDFRSRLALDAVMNSNLNLLGVKNGLLEFIPIHMCRRKDMTAEPPVECDENPVLFRSIPRGLHLSEHGYRLQT